MSGILNLIYWSIIQTRKLNPNLFENENYTKSLRQIGPSASCHFDDSYSAIAYTATNESLIDIVRDLFKMHLVGCLLCDIF